MAGGGGGGGGSGAAIAGAASSAVGMIPALIGRGKNNRTASNFGQSEQYDPNAGLWAGRQGAADAYAQRYQNNANQWQNQAGQYGQQAQGLYAGGQSSMWQQQDARAQQQDAAAMARARATGQVPSIAQQQTDRGIARVGQQADMARQQAFAQQSAQASSARGAAGLALAQQGAANNTANVGQSITANQMAQQADMANAGAVAASQERLAAEQAYAQQSGAIRGGDQSAAQTQYGAAAQAGQLGLGAGQVGVQYGQLENDVRKAEMQAKTQQQATLAQSYGQSEQLNQQTANQNAEKKGLIETVGDFFSDGRTKLFLSDGRAKDFGGFGFLGGSMAGATQQDASNASAYKLDPSGGMDVDATIRQQAESGTKFVNDPTGGMVAGARADGGPVDGGKPYLVGERGPEIVVPGQDGTVIPNHAISTWGSGGPDLDAQAAAVTDAGIKANNANFAAQEAANWKNPYQRDLDEIQGQRRVSRMLGQESGLTEDDKRRERAAKFMLNQKPDPAEEEAKNKPPAQSSVDGGPGRAPIWGEGMGQSSPDPPNAEAAMNPWMLALQNASRNLNEAQFGVPHRADGGPVKAGQPYMMGERGPEVVMPLAKGLGKLRTTQWAPDGSGSATMPMLGDYASLGVSPRVTEEGRGVLVHDPIAAKSTATTKDAGESAGAEREGRAKAAQARPSRGSAEVDLDKAAADLERSTKAEWAARLAQGPAIRPADALAGRPYVYKDEYRPPEQAPGEVNYGPTAQTMQQNPVTASAVKRDPQTGLLSVDANKLAKVNSTAIADLQRQIDGLALNSGGRR